VGGAYFTCSGAGKPFVSLFFGGLLWSPYIDVVSVILNRTSGQSPTRPDRKSQEFSDGEHVFEFPNDFFHRSPVGEIFCVGGYNYGPVAHHSGRYSGVNQSADFFQ
jgi:hypothetical protein